MYRRLQSLPHPWCRRDRCAVPPSPALMHSLLQRYAEPMADQRLPAATTFRQ